MTIQVTTTGTFSQSVDTNLTALELVNAATPDMGIQVFTKLVGNSDRTAIEVLQFMTDACEEITRRVDWGNMLAEVELTGTGTWTDFTLPLDFWRLIVGGAIMFNGKTVRGGLSDSEWNELAPVEGTPRYYHLRGSTLSFYPYLAASEKIKIRYVSKSFTVAGQDKIIADDDRMLFPHRLLSKCLIYRWRRHIGQDYEDYQAEFEAMLETYAEFDVEDRTP